MRKATLIATCLLNSKLIDNLDFGENAVRIIFDEMRPGLDFDKWNTQLSDSDAQSFIARGRGAKRINIKSFIRDLDDL